MNEKKDSLALASFIVGIISVLIPGVGIFSGAIAIVLGIIALRNGVVSHDKVFSIIGIIAGLFPWLMFLFSLVLFNFMIFS